ncbi:hypothetical protein GCM10022270_07800 [Terriglobus aquaticus]
MPAPPAPWSHLHRVLFRVAFVYFLLFAFCYGNGNLFDIIPVVGDRITQGLNWPLDHLAEWISTHVLHYSGIGATHHETGSGDTLVQWVEEWVFVGVAIVAGLLWSAIAAARGHRRVEYTTAHAWLRFLLRLTCGMFMLSYGFAKLFPMQMPPISTAVLNEPVGNMSPMTMLWSLLALNPAYQIICGAAEVIGGVLILFRRTALAGALVSAFVMTNVLLYNLFFDVPVKLFAANLLLALVFITLPDVPALFRFFWLHQPAAPAGVWIPQIERKRFRIATRVVEVIFIIAFLIAGPILNGIGWWKYHKASLGKTPLQGAWHIDAPTPSLASPEQQPITAIYVDSPTLVRTRSTDGALWRTSLRCDEKTPACNIRIYTTGSRARYAWKAVDADHMVLTAIPPRDAKPQDAAHFHPYTLTLTRIPLPTHYPLLDRGFHWVNEWGLER